MELGSGTNTLGKLVGVVEATVGIPHDEDKGVVSVREVVPITLISGNMDIKNETPNVHGDKGPIFP